MNAIESAALLFRRGGHAHDAIVHLAHLLQDMLEGAGHAVGNLLTLGGACDRFGNLVVGLARGHGRTLGERSHLLGDDGKPGPGFTGASGLHRGVEREQVGLKGDLVDALDDMADLIRRGADRAHRTLHGVDLGVAGFNALAGLRGELFAGGGIVGVLTGHAPELLERGADLLDRRSLFRRTLGKVRTGAGNLG